MFHLDNNSVIDVMPVIKQTLSRLVKWFTEGDSQTPPSYPGADWFNIVQAELLNVLKGAEIEPDKEQLNQLSSSIKKMILSEKVKLSSAVNSSAEDQAATPKAVKIAYDLASNAVKKSGDEMSGQLQFNASAAGIKFKYETGAQIVLRTGSRSFGFMFNDAGSDLWKSKLRYNYDTNIWNFENINNVTINGKSVLKAGDCGISSQTGAEVTNFDEHLNSGFYGTNSSKVTNSPHPTPASASLMILPTENQNWKIEQLSVVSGNAPRIYYRADTKNSGKQQWIESITSANVEKYAYRFHGYLNNENLNNIKATRHGVYLQNMNEFATAQNNYPLSAAGSLIVTQTGGDGIDGCVQIYTDYYSVRQFVRTYRDAPNTWSPWVEQITSSNISSFLPRQQNWYNVISQRAANVVYLNTTGQTIFVRISFQHGWSGTAIDMRLFINEMEFYATAGGSGSGSTKNVTMYMPIPAGCTYRVTGGGNLTAWDELR